MLYVGLDLSRKRLDYHASLADGEVAAVGACPPDRDGLTHLVHGLDAEGARARRDRVDERRPLCP
jgi:hypothetical protein